MAERAKRLKGRFVFLMVHKRNEQRRFYMGSSIKQIAIKAGIHPQTLTRTAKLCEKSPDGSYETANYLIYVTGKDGFIRGLTRHGYFSYEH